MQKTKLACLFLTSAILLSTTTFGAKTAEATKPVSLLRARCVESGFGNARVENLDVSIGRAVYTSQFYLGPGYRSAALTCKIQPDKSPKPVFQTLNLGFGMRDNTTVSPSVDVKIFLDGKLTEARTVSPTQQVTASLDVSNVSNVSIEATCSSATQYCDRVYFFTAALERIVPAKKAN
jgi:hypothetical protein